MTSFLQRERQIEHGLELVRLKKINVSSSISSLNTTKEAYLRGRSLFGLLV